MTTSLQHLSKSISKLSGKMFERKYVTLGRLLDQWPLIVGENMAHSTAPVKITYRKGRDKSTPPIIGLVISANSAQITRLHYRKDLLLQKINQILGDKTITQISFVDRETSRSASLGTKSNGINRPVKKKNLTMPQEKDLSDMLDNIDDDALRETLRRYGRSMMIDGSHANETNKQN